MNEDQDFLRQAIALARANIENGGRPFGAVLARGGRVVATGVNEILTTNDPTSHAELNAIRAASQKLASPNLAGCTVYASGHPCPMCLAAMRMAGVEQVVYAYSNEDAEPYGLSTATIYTELAKPFSERSMGIRHVAVAEERDVDIYREWQRRQEGWSN